MRRIGWLPLLWAVLGIIAGGSCDESTPPDGAGRQQPQNGWRLVRHETFNRPFVEPPEWTEDTDGANSPYHVDAFDEDGAFFVSRGGNDFTTRLQQFRSFRKSFAYGDDGWLTVELYGRDSDRDGVPETGGRFVAENGRARVVTTRHYDGAIIRPTQPLPRRYRVEVTVSNIRFGGKAGGDWMQGGKVNGYDGDEIADPWRFTNTSTTPIPAYTENGVYFLAIVDYPRPAPHNNVFIHHHRKVVMDTDNNMEEWSQVWNPRRGRPERDGSHYVSMIWLNGETFGSDFTGNPFVSYTPGGWQQGTIFVDKYLDGESYVFTIERDGDRYTMSVSGRFYYGGQTTYRASRQFRESPVTWHYNQTAGEYGPPYFNETRTYGDTSFETWPPGSTYPDFFLFGDPHINFYEGTAEYDDLRLYLPAGESTAERR